LNSIPREIAHINVTMGYPLKDTPLARLIVILSELHQHAATDGNIRYYHKDVTNLFQNPLIRTVAKQSISEWFNLFQREEWVFISAEQLLKILPENFNVIFKELNSTTEIIPYLREVLFMLSENSLPDELQPGFITGFISQLNKFENSIHDHLHLFDKVTCWRAIHEIVHSTRIPFEGEPVDGIQIMGFLETRNLDFDNLIILSCNENLLPPSGKSGSFIPYPIRKGFGLPSFEEKDAISAYHFYRLLQRAKNITLIYDTEIKSVIGGEKSRFLLQIEHELAKNNLNIQLTKKIISTAIKREQADSLSVDKTEEVMKLLLRFTNTESNEFQKRLSASALIDYINCPMQFYFKHVAQIKELTGPDEDLNAIPFGQVLHRAIEILYQEKDILHLEEEKTTSMIETAVTTAIAEQFSNPEDILKGKNILLRDVILELLKSIIRNDRQTTDLVIKELESKLSFDFKLNNGLTVGLHGVADRVDFTENVLRIIDYKTGHVYINKSLEIEKIFNDVKFKAVFQAFYYAYLFKRMKSAEEIKAGIYNLPKANSGISFLSNDRVLSQAQIEQFEHELKQLLGQMFNQDIPFRQTDDVNRCTWCAYSDICHR
jgi:CRISPR/Cas system-associated exonuclease Cas4 (RecB family)